MKASVHLISYYSFTIAVLLLLARPVIVFTSGTLASPVTAAESGQLVFHNTVKKRKITFRIRNIFSKENESVLAENFSLVFFLTACKKWLTSLFILFSLLLSSWVRLLKRRNTFFHIVAASRHHLALSVIRI